MLKNNQKRKENLIFPVLAVLVVMAGVYFFGQGITGLPIYEHLDVVDCSAYNSSATSGNWGPNCDNTYPGDHDKD